MKTPKFKIYFNGSQFTSTCWYGDLYCHEGIVSLPEEDGWVCAMFTGLVDKNKTEVYADDIITDGKKKFRVYQVEGGFVIKAYAWADNRKDLIRSDELIFMPLADAQTKSYIMQSCEVIGNLNSNPELI